MHTGIYLQFSSDQIFNAACTRQLSHIGAVPDIPVLEQSLCIKYSDTWRHLQTYVQQRFWQGRTNLLSALGFLFGIYPASILYKSTASRYRLVSYADGPITARCRFIKNAYWDSLAYKFYIMLASTSEIAPFNMCDQQRFRSACAFAQSDQNLRCSHFWQPRMQIFFKKTTKTLIRLRGYPGWFESSFGAHVRRYVF